jgi:hypothetical protein
VGSPSEYLERGPGFVFLAHPALGPLWSVVGQKLRGGSLAARAELQLEVAQACLQGVHVQGSLRVLADSPLGHYEMRPAETPSSSAASGGPVGPGANGSMLLSTLLRTAEGSAGSGSGGSGSSSLGGFGPSLRLVGGGTPPSVAPGTTDEGYSQPCTFPAVDCEASAHLEPRLVYSERCGRVRLHNVRVRNAGVDWEHPGNVWWRHSLARREACEVVLRGASGEPAAGAAGGGTAAHARLVPAKLGAAHCGSYVASCSPD